LDDLLKAGKILKSRETRRHRDQPLHGQPTSRSGLSCGATAQGAWRRTARRRRYNSDKAAQVVEWYKELYRDAMEPEVLSWDNASNNRFLLSGKGSWIHNPISPYVAAVTKKMPIADEINHHNTPGGPAGIHSATGVNSLGIWKFSKNVALAKDFVKFLFQKENYDAFIVGAARSTAAPQALRRAPHLGEQPKVRPCCPRKPTTCTSRAGRPSPMRGCS